MRQANTCHHVRALCTMQFQMTFSVLLKNSYLNLNFIHFFFISFLVYLRELMMGSKTSCIQIDIKRHHKIKILLKTKNKTDSKSINKTYHQTQAETIVNSNDITCNKCERNENKFKKVFNAKKIMFFYEEFGLYQRLLRNFVMFTKYHFYYTLYNFYKTFECKLT